jgi:hypothetical protein
MSINLWEFLISKIISFFSQIELLLKWKTNIVAGIFWFNLLLQFPFYRRRNYFDSSPAKEIFYKYWWLLYSYNSVILKKIRKANTFRFHLKEQILLFNANRTFVSSVNKFSLIFSFWVLCHYRIINDCYSCGVRSDFCFSNNDGLYRQNYDNLGFNHLNFMFNIWINFKWCYSEQQSNSLSLPN